MEISSWGCIPTADQLALVRRCDWQWHSNIFHGSDNDILRNVGNVVASEQRSLGHLRDLSVCIFWFDRRLLLSATIQDDARSGMEKSRSIDGDSISRRSLHDVFLPKFLHLGKAQLWRGTFHYYGGLAMPLVWYLASPRLSRLLLWLSQAALHTSGQNQPDPQTSP